LALLTQYRSIRLKDQANVDEVEFNFGRAFHQLGRLWSFSPDTIDRLVSVTNQSIGVSREAAYNLSLIYMATGATGLVRALYRKWLSI
ncbi:hypothetical protein JB92DRAFT_2776027, partial [Gautieria morchelliformis]